MLPCVCRVARETLRGRGEVARIVGCVNVGVCCINVVSIVGRAVAANKRGATVEHISGSDRRAPVISDDGRETAATFEHICK